MIKLVIAGNQSTGKSSLLENLTGLPVPTNTGIGTRFPIDINLIESPVYEVKATIVLDLTAARAGSVESHRITDFSRVYNTPLTVSQFENLLSDVSPFSFIFRNLSQRFSGFQLTLNRLQKC